MAKGLSAAIARIATVIEGCDDSTWKRSRQRISGMKDPNVISSGLDGKYWVHGKVRKERAIVHGSLITTNNTVFVELARYWGKGDRLQKDHYNLHQTLEAQADIVEQSLLLQTNWAVSDTGVILVNMRQGIVEELQTPEILLWTAEFNVMIRHPKVATVVV
jgi:hypothetical protein